MLRNFQNDNTIHFYIKRIASIFSATNLDVFKIECCCDLLKGMSFSRKPVATKKQQFFYAVGIGRRTGVFNAWSEIEPLIKGLTNAKYRKFPSYEEAKNFVEQHASPCRSSPFKLSSPPVTPPQPNSTSSRFLSDSSVQHVQEKARNISALFQNQLLQSTSQTAEESEEAETFLTLSQESSSTVSVSASQAKPNQLSVESQIATFQKRLTCIKKDLHNAVEVVEEKVTQIDQLQKEFDIFRAEHAVNEEHGRDLKRTLARLNERKEGLEASNPKKKKTKMIDVDNCSPGTSNGTNGSTGNCFNNFVFDQEGYCIVFTDGACTNNGQAGAKAGIGIWFGPNHPLNTGDPLRNCPPTNNNAEIQAASYALNTSKVAGLKKIAIHTDSQFLINCITKWINRWKQNGWRNTDGKPVINRVQLEVLEDAKEGLEVKWVHVRGHSNILGNEMADRLANDGAAKYEHQSP